MAKFCHFPPQNVAFMVLKTTGEKGGSLVYGTLGRQTQGLTVHEGFKPAGVASGSKQLDLTMCSN